MPTPPTIPPVAPSQVQMQDIDYSSLLGTLGPLLEFAGLDAATQQHNLAQLHQGVQAAQQSAQQAGQQYQQAAQQQTAPPQPADYNFFDQLLGNTASVLGRNPDYAQAALERGQQHQRDLAATRLANLTALKDNYDRQAQAAEKLGNLEMAAQLRAKGETVDKSRTALITEGMQGHEKVVGQANAQGGAMELQNLRGTQATGLQDLKGEQAMALEKLKGNFALELQKLKGALKPEDEAWIQNAIIHTDSGDVVDVGGLIGTAKNKAIIAARNLGMNPVDKDQKKVLDDIQGAKQNVLSIMQQANELLPKTPAERPAWAGHVWAARLTQNDPFIVAFDTWRSGAIKNLRATAGSGGLRINQREIDLAVKYDVPNIFDTAPVAQQKMQNIMTMLNNGERVLTSRDWRQQNALLQKKASFPDVGQVLMMDPQGNQKRVDVRQAQNLTNNGWARIVDPTWAFGTEQPEIPTAKVKTNGPASDPLGILGGKK